MNSDGNTANKMQDNVRMSGFLQKKGKMKLMSQWKKYWFILEERLLLYYRSEVEYTNLSPCKGSLNMGLVTAVRPGSSTGPYIIHIITRTQVIQLRAVNRATQEKWLKALLHSMSLPLVTFKALKPLAKNPYLKRCGSSLDNIALKDTLHFGELENDWTLPRKLDFSKRGLQITGTFLGGSLDTNIGSKKYEVRTPSPNISKGKFLDKILGFAKESDSLGGGAVRSRDSRLSPGDKKEMKFVGRDLGMDGVSEKCNVHKENHAQDFYSTTNKIKKKMNRTLSDTELNKIPSPKFNNNSYLSLENVKTERKDGSAFERIKNALSRIPKDNILKGKTVLEKERKPLKKKRHSFLQKVFKKKEWETRDFESQGTDALYDTIEHLQEQTRNSIPPEFINEDNTVTKKENQQESTTGLESLYAEVQKPVVGSKIILSAKTMSELRLKLKSRENFDVENRTGKTVPSLPPRRVSRPISPWHDVPTNNSPVGSDAKYFFVHQAVVKFNDKVPPIEIPKEESDYSDTENDFRFHLTKSGRGSLDSLVQEKKNDDLSVLLEQLTKITVAPLAEPELTDDNYYSSSESEKFLSKSQVAEPDYDVPRSHKHLSIDIFEGKEIMSSTEFIGKSDNYSDTGSSAKSVEPDSLEMAEKNYKY